MRLTLMSPSLRVHFHILERVKIGSNKICIREDLAMENMVFGQESSQAVHDMENVEIVELIKDLQDSMFLMRTLHI